MYQETAADQFDRDAGIEDEIRLIDIWNVLVGSKTLIFGITAVATGLAVVAALLMPRVYQASVYLYPPRLADIEAVNSVGVLTRTPEEVFARFLEILAARNTARELFDERGLLGVLGPESGREVNPDVVFEKFFEEISLRLPEAPRAGQPTTPGPVVISLAAKDPEFAAQTLNGLVRFAERRTTEIVRSGLQAKISSRVTNLVKQIAALRTVTARQRADRIARIEEADARKRIELLDRIAALRARAASDRQAEIARLEEADRIKREGLVKEIDVKLAYARVRRLDTVTRLTEAANVAKAAKIKGPSPLRFSHSGERAAGQTSVVTEINTGAQPLYLRGEVALRAEINELEARHADDSFIADLRDMQEQLERLKTNEKIEALKSRESDDPFIPELRELQKQLQLLEDNRELEALKARQVDDPYIKKLRELEEETARLQNVAVDEIAFTAATVDQFAYAPTIPVRPKRRQIVAVGLALGLLLSVLVVFLRSTLAKERLAAG